VDVWLRKLASRLQDACCNARHERWPAQGILKAAARKVREKATNIVEEKVKGHVAERIKAHIPGTSAYAQEHGQPASAPATERVGRAVDEVKQRARGGLERAKEKLVDAEPVRRARSAARRAAVGKEKLEWETEAALPDHDPANPRRKSDVPPIQEHHRRQQQKHT
jgi:hypothetical protein